MTKGHSVVLSTLRPGQPTIQEALHDITDKGHWRLGHKKYKREEQHFFDQIVSYLHVPLVFDLGRVVELHHDIYITNRRKVLLRDVSHNFLSRCLFDLTRPPVVMVALFSTLRLTVGDLPNQVLCCAAGVKECVSDPAGYTNVSRDRFSWFKLLLGMGFSVVDPATKTPIRDDYNSSILELVSDWNLKYLLKKLVLEKVTRIYVFKDTLYRYSRLSHDSASIRKSLSAIQIKVIE